jgi:hypothetical protein
MYTSLFWAYLFKVWTNSRSDKMQWKRIINSTSNSFCKLDFATSFSIRYFYIIIVRVLYSTTTFRLSEQQQNTKQVLKWINSLNQCNCINLENKQLVTSFKFVLECNTKNFALKWPTLRWGEMVITKFDPIVRVMVMKLVIYIRYIR